MNAHEHLPSHCTSILIIDDDAATLELYGNVFQGDFLVFTSTNARDAMDILASQALQLVILEPAVAGSQGWEFLTEIRQLYGIPVVVCSTWDNRKSGLEAGAAAYLIKPVLPSTLVEILKSILN